jgi:hypothetical protein
MTKAGTTEAYVVDGSAATSARKLNDSLSSGSNVENIGFLSDSSAVWYQVGKSPTSTLYKSSVLSASLAVDAITSNYESFAFQP